MSSAQIKARIKELNTFLKNLNVAKGKLADKMTVVDSIKSNATAGLNVDGKTFGESELNSVSSNISLVKGNINGICANVQAEIAKLQVQLIKALAKEAEAAARKVENHIP